MLEYKIDALIGSPAVRPFIPQPNLLDLGFPLRVMGEEPFNEMLKLLADEVFKIITFTPVPVDGFEKLRKGRQSVFFALIFR